MDFISKDVTSNGSDHSNGELVELPSPYTPEEEKAVLRKIDLVILPFVSDPHCSPKLHR